jgi:hypothetical protein
LPFCGAAQALGSVDLQQALGQWRQRDASLSLHLFYTIGDEEAAAAGLQLNVEAHFHFPLLLQQHLLFTVSRHGLHNGQTGEQQGTQPK